MEAKAYLAAIPDSWHKRLWMPEVVDKKALSCCAEYSDFNGADALHDLWGEYFTDSMIASREQQRDGEGELQLERFYQEKDGIKIVYTVFND